MQKKVSQSHNLSAEQMQDLKDQQNAETALPTVNGKGEVKGHKILAHEKHLVHAKITVPQFNPNTGEDESQSHIQKFDVKEFERMKREQAFAGRKVVILHDGGEPDVEGAEATDSLKPQIVSQPGAGLDLTKDYSKATASELKEAYKQFFPGDEAPPTTKAELLEAIQSRVAFLDAEQREKYQQIEENRLNAADNRDLQAGQQ